MIKIRVLEGGFFLKQLINNHTLEKSRPAEASNQSSSVDTLVNDLSQLKEQLNELTSMLNEANGANASLSDEKNTLLSRIKEMDKRIVEYEK